MPFARLRLGADRVLDAVGDWAERQPKLAIWRRDRFYAQVSRRLAIVEVEGASGARYFVHTNDAYIGRDLMLHGAFDVEKIELALALLEREGMELDQLLDIGANIGTTVIEILGRRPDMTAVAFEPEPRNFELLRINLLANGLESRVQARQMALGDATAQATLELAAANLGDHRVRVAGARTDGVFGEQHRATIRVPVARLDDVEVRIDRRTLLFMDVQGMEGHVLAGAANALQARPPLVLELWPYGLDRVGGLDRLFAGLEGYGRLYDLGTSPPTAYSPADLPRLLNVLTGRADRTAALDLMALG